MIISLVRRRLATMATATFYSSTLTLRVAICLAALWAIFALIAVETRQHASVQAATFGTNVASLVETAIAREFETYDLSVQALAAASVDPTILALSPVLRRKVMFDQSADASNLGRLLVIDRDGRAIAASKDDLPIGLDYSERDYFIAQRAEPNLGLFVGGPFISRIGGLPSIGLSRRRLSTDGSFTGIAVGTIRLSLFEGLFSAIHLSPGSTITLLKRDGTILTRVPLRLDLIGRNLINGELAKALVREAGIFTANSPVDGVERLFATHRVGGLPLYVVVGLSTRETYASWRWEMMVIGSGFAFLSAIIVLLGFNLGGELRRRGRAEAVLAEMASTDYLTRLANRRRFDEVLAAEWRRGARARSRLSLLMVDGDFFKSFNDTYGHIEGDRALRAIADALKTCVDRPGDLVARYGGEEFAVLLPATDGGGATTVASAIRAAIDALDLIHAAAPGGRFTVSIGIACRVPDVSVRSETLVEAADAALYVAKGEGRDRIVMEGEPSAPPMMLERRVA